MVAFGRYLTVQLISTSRVLRRRWSLVWCLYVDSSWLVAALDNGESLARGIVALRQRGRMHCRNRRGVIVLVWIIKSQVLRIEEAALVSVLLSWKWRCRVWNAEFFLRGRGPFLGRSLTYARCFEVVYFMIYLL